MRRFKHLKITVDNAHDVKGCVDHGSARMGRKSQPWRIETRVFFWLPSWLNMNDNRERR